MSERYAWKLPRYEHETPTGVDFVITDGSKTYWENYSDDVTIVTWDAEDENGRE